MSPRTMLILLVCTLDTPGLSRAEELTVASALAQRMIDPQLPLSEVQSYTESRILPMPEPTSVDAWESYANAMRQDVLQNVVFRGRAAQWKDIDTRVEWLGNIDGGPGYHIRRLRYEAVPGMWVAALLYEPDQLKGRVPVVMNVNGHDRTDGKAADYKQRRCIHQAQHGMIALNIEWLGMGQLNTPGFSHYSMNQLDLCGTSGLAPFYLSMSRGLDILLQHEHADPARVAVAGLSGGGWQTIFISSLDTRVTLCNPVAGYSSFRTRSRFLSDLGDSEQTPCDLASVTDYAQLTAMLAPRPALLTKNAEDNCCFKAEHALPPLLEAAQPVYDLYGRSDHLRYHINHDPGTHNFGPDNRRQLYRMLDDFFFPETQGPDSEENIADDEIRTKEELAVELPADNLDFNSLALKLSDQLKRSKPADAATLPAWQRKARPVLNQVIRAQDFHTLAIRQSEQHSEALTATGWWLRFGGDWTVPATELSRPDTDHNTCTIFIADDGRATVAAQAQAKLDAGHRILALDPFYFGESKIAQRDFLFAILVSSIGDRPLGIQAGQLQAAARWARQEFNCESVQVVARGPRTSLIALAAAGLDDEAIDRVELHDSLGSLRELLEQNKGMNHVPESLCFALLQHFDIAELVAVAGPSRVQFVNPTDRCRQELQATVDAFPVAARQLFSDAP
ncbi:MAG: acetylxylan esterase [Fuerstiella sp.]